MMDEQVVFYRHSGRFSVAGWVCTFATTALAASLLGCLYSLAILYIPLIYVNVLLVFGFGLAAGAVALMLGVHFKIRNVWAACLAALLGLLVGYYVSWAVWLAHHLHTAKVNISFTDLL